MRILQENRIDQQADGNKNTALKRSRTGCIGSRSRRRTLGDDCSNEEGSQGYAQPSITVTRN